MIVNLSLGEHYDWLELILQDLTTDQISTRLGRRTTMVRFPFPEQPDSFLIGQQHWRRASPQVTTGGDRLRFDLSYQALRQLSGNRVPCCVSNLSPCSVCH